MAKKQELAHVETKSTPGELILQWLSYAFWGWLAIALSFLIAITATASTTGKTDAGDTVAYAIAASIILLITAFVLDWFYMKKESMPKTGGAMIIMVIHAVIFGLFCAGWLIAFVFSLINITINNGDSEEATAISITAIVMAIFYAVLLVRTLDLQAKKFKKPAVITVSIIALGAVFLGFIGPVATTAATKNDRLVESSLRTIGGAVDDYTNDNNELPDNLSAILSEVEPRSRADITTIIDQNLVTYKKSDAAPVIGKKGSLQYSYTLCATYSRSAGDPYDYWDGKRSSGKDDFTESSLYSVSSSHPAGEECYQLKTSDYRL